MLYLRNNGLIMSFFKSFGSKINHIQVMASTKFKPSIFEAQNPKKTLNSYNFQTKQATPIGERDNSVYGMRAGSQGWKGEDGKAKTQW